MDPKPIPAVPFLGTLPTSVMSFSWHVQPTLGSDPVPSPLEPLALSNPCLLSLSVPRCVMDLEQGASESLQSQGPQRLPGEGLLQ